MRVGEREEAAHAGIADVTRFKTDELTRHVVRPVGEIRHAAEFVRCRVGTLAQHTAGSGHDRQVSARAAGRDFHALEVFGIDVFVEVFGSRRGRAVQHKPHIQIGQATGLDLATFHARRIGRGHVHAGQVLDQIKRGAGRVAHFDKLLAHGLDRMGRRFQPHHAAATIIRVPRGRDMNLFRALVVNHTGRLCRSRSRGRFRGGCMFRCRGDTLRGLLLRLVRRCRLRPAIGPRGDTDRAHQARHGTQARFQPRHAQPRETGATAHIPYLAFYRAINIPARLHSFPRKSVCAPMFRRPYRFPVAAIPVCLDYQQAQPVPVLPQVVTEPEHSAYMLTYEIHMRPESLKNATRCLSI